MKTSRTRIALSFAFLALAAMPLAGCSKRADASTQAAPSGTNEPQVAPPPSDAPAAGSSDRAGDGSPRAKEGRGRHHGKRGDRGDRAERGAGKPLARLREILSSAGVSREQTKIVFQRLRAERSRGGDVRADQVLADVLPSLTPEQREEATRIVRESAKAPAEE